MKTVALSIHEYERAVSKALTLRTKQGDSLSVRPSAQGRFQLMLTPSDKHHTVTVHCVELSTEQAQRLAQYLTQS